MNFFLHFADRTHSMKRYTFLLLSLAFLLPLGPAQAQLPTSLLDDFDRMDSAELGMTPTDPTSIQWSESGQAAASESGFTSGQTIRLNNDRAELHAAQMAGVKIATIDMSNVSGYSTTLSDASGVMTWAFNVRQSKSNPGGFGSTGDGGVGFAIASAGADLDDSNALAVVIGSDGGTDPIQLVNYNGGYSANGDFEVIAGGSNDLSNDYVSVKVTFDPTTSPSTWTLYANSGSNSFPTSDPRTLDGTHQVGQAMTNSGTGNQRKYVGLLWDHGATDENAIFDDIYVTDPNGRLPVELASFDVVTDDRQALLNWTTASETNNVGFTVQRKVNGSFQNVGFVEGAGTVSQPQDYRYTTDALAPGRHTFRLRQEDVDGTTHLGPTRTVKVQPTRSGLSTTGTNPVPGGTPATFTVSADEAQPVTVALVNALGQTVRTVHEGHVSASTELSVETTSLSSGVYFLRAEGRSFTSTQKFTVVR